MICILLLILIISFGIFCKWNNNYWYRRNVDGPKPKLLFGNLFEYLILRKHFGEVYDEIYKAFSKAAYVGIYKFGTPSILVRDLNLLKSILIENFDHFRDNDIKINSDTDPILSKNLTFSDGNLWQIHRKQILPVFTPSKVKSVFPIVRNVCSKTLEYIKNETKKINGNENKIFETRTLCSKFTIESIASCGFGLEANAFADDESAFVKQSRKVFDASIMQTIRTLLALFVPALNKVLKMAFLPAEVDAWIRSVVRQVVSQRDKEGAERRSDFMQGLLDIRIRSKSFITEETIVGHALSLLLDGFETSSIMMTYCLYELAINPDIQNIVQEEIKDSLERFGDNGKLTEESLQSMKYLEKTLYETLRMHCPDFIMSRLCTKDFLLPPQYPGGKEVLISAGTPVIIPIYSIHYDSNIYENPNKFDPTRFSENEIQSRPKCSFLAFGDGPRLCIGIKFGLMQVKAAIAIILSEFNVRLSPKTKEPLSISRKSIMLFCEDGIWIEFEKR